MTTNAQQLEMLGQTPEPISVELQEQIARRCKNRQEAIRKTFDVSGLEPKQVYGQLKMDQGQFSKLYSGQKALPNDQYHKYQETCRNWILLRYDALHSGHELKPIETDAEMRIKELEAELADRDRAIKYFVQMLKGAS